MDIRSFFAASEASSSQQTDIQSEESSESEAESETELEPSPAKKKKGVHEKSRSKYRPATSSRKYNKKWEERFDWLIFNDNFQGAFCKVCRKRGLSFERTGGTRISKPFKNWKKAVEKMKAHAKSKSHIQSCEAEIAAARALQVGTIVQQLQQIEDEEKAKNRLAIKALIRCTHFLVRRHIAHTTNFDELVDLVVSCGAEDLRRFLESAGKNASYMSKVAVVEFVEVIGLWAEESLLKRLRQASNFSIMADECTDVTTIERAFGFLLLGRRWDTS